MKNILLREGALRPPEHIVFNDAVMFQLHQQTVLIHLKQLLGCILTGKTVFLHDLDGQFLSGK